MPNSFAAEETPTYEVWQFAASGDSLATLTIADVSGDDIDDLVVAALDRSVYLVDGETGKRLWNYTGDKFYPWRALVSSPALDATGDGRPEVIVSTRERLVISLDGSDGQQLWNYTNAGVNALFKPGGSCSLAVRSAHLVSDIDGDSLPDLVVVAGSGDTCTKDDQIRVVALSANSGLNLWEYVHEEDYHGLKDGTKRSSPVAVIDFDKDGTKDIVVADDQGSVHVINGLTGKIIQHNKLPVFGAIWNLVEVPDVSGDGVNDVVALEFIDGKGGSDYASLAAIDLISSQVLWEVKIGDGKYSGGALYSAAWMADEAPGRPATILTYLAATQRIDDNLKLVVLNGKTGEQNWEFPLGNDKSRNDMDKSYPVSRIADTTGRSRDELAVTSIDSRLYLMSPKNGAIVWSHPVSGQIKGISSIPASESQKYILVESAFDGIKALARQTTIDTTLSIQVSAQTIVPSSRLIVTGNLSPPFPGEIVNIRYVDPDGAVTSKPLVLAKDGSYTDVIEPKELGDWKVSSEFNGEGFYLDAISPIVGFTVENETKDSIYTLQVDSEDDTSVSYLIAYLIEGGQLADIAVDTETRSLIVALDSPSAGGKLRVDLPRAVIDAQLSEYQVYVDGRPSEFEELSADASTRTLSIPFEQDAEQIKITGTYIVPEFSFASVILALTMVALIAAVSARSIRSVWFKNKF